MIFFQIKNGKSKTPEINKPSKASEATPEISPKVLGEDAPEIIPEGEPNLEKPNKVPTDKKIFLKIYNL